MKRIATIVATLAVILGGMLTFVAPAAQADEGDTLTCETRLYWAQHYQRVWEGIATDNGRRIMDLEGKLRTVDETAHEWQARTERAEADAQALRVEAAALRQTVAARDAQIARLRDRVSHLRNQLRALR